MTNKFASKEKVRDNRSVKIESVKKLLFYHPGHLIWVLIAYFPFLWMKSVSLTGDEKVYIAAAMEMREKPSALIPYLMDAPNYLKPPFQYWMTLLGWKLWGFNLFGTYFFSVLAVVATAYLLNEIANLLGERRWQVQAGLWFAATVGTLTFGMSAQMEVYLCLMFCLSWFLALKFLCVEEQERKWHWIYAAFAVAGVSALVKSPLYSVFWVMSFVLYLLLSGEWLLFKRKHLYLAALTGVGIGLVWFIYAYQVDRERFWTQYILEETFGKKGGNGSDPLGIWLNLLYFCFPFTLMSLTGLRAVWKGRRTSQVFAFVVCYSLLPALFFSFHPYRVSTYLYILVPAFALVTDWGSFRVNRTRTFVWTSRLTSLVMILGMAMIAFILWRARLISEGLSILITLSGLAGGIVIWLGHMKAAAILSLLSLLLIRMGLVSIGESDLEGLRKGIHSRVPLAMLDSQKNIWNEIGLLSVAIGRPMKRLYTVKEVQEFMSLGGQVILSDEDTRSFLDEIKADALQKNKKLDLYLWKRYKGRRKFPYRELILYGKAGIPDFDQEISREFLLLKQSN